MAYGDPSTSPQQDLYKSKTSHFPRKCRCICLKGCFFSSLLDFPDVSRVIENEYGEARVIFSLAFCFISFIHLFTDFEAC